jgi:hypothetical protein
MSPADLIRGSTLSGAQIAAGRRSGGASNARMTIQAGYGLVRLERGERGRITPKVTHDRVELDLPLAASQNAT